MSVPKLRFKEFDGDWDIYKLGSLFTKRRDKGIANVPTYSVTLNNGIVNREDLDRDTVTNLSPEEHLLVKKDDLAYNMMRMWQGALGLAPTDGIVSPAYVVLKPNDKKSNSYFFEYYFKTNRQIHNFWAYSQGLTEDRLRLYFDDFKLIKINAPIKEEQTKIASFLCAVDEKISQLTQKHELLSQYKQGMMQKLFSQQIRFKADDGSEFGEWEEKILKDLFPKIRNGFVGVATPYYVDYGVKYLQGKNIKNGKIDDKGLIYINQEFHQKKINSILKTNDILMVQSGHVGECSVVTEDYDNANCHALLVLSPKSSKLINSKFVVYYFYSEIGKKKITLIKTGNTIEHILASDIKEVSLLFPCIEEQTKIANFLSIIDQKIDVVAQQIEQAKQWKKGLLQQMFV